MGKRHVLGCRHIQSDACAVMHTKTNELYNNPFSILIFSKRNTLYKIE